MVRLENIRKTFNAGKATEVSALQGVTLSVEAKDFLVVIGANGSGKSTLLNSIAGSVLPESGKIFIREQEVNHLPEYKRSRWIARVFQNPLTGTASELSILANFRLAAIRKERKNLRLGITDTFRNLVRERIAGLEMGLENKLDQPMGTLSGGQRQALTLLMTVMAEPDILLLDEPTAALDPRSARIIMNIADQLIKTYQLTAILITHNLNEALHYGNRLLQMQDGLVIRDLNDEEKSNLQQQELLSWFDYFK